MLKILLLVWVASALFFTYMFCAAARRYVSDAEETRDTPLPSRERDCRKAVSVDIS